MPEPVVLKKYANRRLYDTSRSVYVTLDEVAGGTRLTLVEGPAGPVPATVLLGSVQVLE